MKLLALGEHGENHIHALLARFFFLRSLEAIGNRVDVRSI